MKALVLMLAVLVSGEVLADSRSHLKDVIEFCQIKRDEAACMDRHLGFRPDQGLIDLIKIEIQGDAMRDCWNSTKEGVRACVVRHGVPATRVDIVTNHVYANSMMARKVVFVLLLTVLMIALIIQRHNRRETARRQAPMAVMLRK